MQCNLEGKWNLLNVLIWEKSRYIINQKTSCSIHALKDNKNKISLFEKYPYKLLTLKRKQKIKLGTIKLLKICVMSKEVISKKA